MRLLFLFAFSVLCAATSGQPPITTICGTGSAGLAGDGGPAVSAELRNPYGLTIGPDDALYVCDMDNHVVRRIKDGTINTVAGTGKRGYTGDGGPALRAELNEPYEVRFDSKGNMYVVEMRNHLVRRISVGSQMISTVAGTGQPGFAGDGGPATHAQLNQPHSIQLDREDNLYICDIGNHRIRKVDMRTGIISTFAGTGEKRKPKDGAPFSEEPLFGPRALDFDREGNIWLALREGNAIYKLDLRGGSIHHVAGGEGKTPSNGPAKTAVLAGPKGLSVAPDGNVYFTDTESHSIKRLNVRAGQIEIVAGRGERGDGPDGDPLKCKLARPHGIYVDKNGMIYVGDSENNRVRVIR